MSTEIANVTKLIVADRDRYQAECEELKRQMAEMKNELQHLRHFRSSVERGLRNLPGGRV